MHRYAATMLSAKAMLAVLGGFAQSTGGKACPGLCSVLVPSKGLSEVLLISSANFLEEGFSSIGLCALKTSAAGRSFASNTMLSSAAAAQHQDDQDSIRCDPGIILGFFAYLLRVYR